MEIVIGLESFHTNFPNTVLTIGNYDGIHLGHEKILSMVIERAKKLRGTSMVMTFDPHPVKVLSPERNVRLLTPTDEKIRLIESAGIDVMLIVNFNREFSSMMPDDFIDEVLVKKLAVREIIVGANYSFGKNKKGTIDLLRRRGEKYGFHVRAARNVTVHGNIVSSSAIRSLLFKGAVSEAARYLGREYSIAGTVIKGKGRGSRLLQIPTANITTPVEIAPKEGVYAVRVEYRGSIYGGVANIGKNPTFGNAEVSYEVHILNFSRNLLGETLRIFFIERIRGERTFPEPASLEKQIRADITSAKEILRSQNPPS
jgi:riboflavin kinase/FMN adenylyltransferase